MNIVYNASAGTGKTYQVTELYEKLVLEEGIDPRKILLMTFTDNAAAELRMRVAQRFLKARRTAEIAGDGERAETAIHAMSRLAAAPIGTIHSFCTRLLREQALEAGLSPGFSTLVGDERDALLNQICRDELLDRLERDPDFKTFCSGAHIIGTGGGFGTSITETVPSLISQANSLGISLENAEAMLPDPQPAGSLPAFTVILDRLKELPNPSVKAKPVIQALETHLPTVESVEKLTLLLMEEGLRKFGGPAGHKPISDDFFDLLNAVDDSIKYKTRFPAAKAFARYVQAVATRFQHRKHEMDVVDFDDQLHMAAELLQSGRVKPEFQYVIVDEVQDTARIQCDLIQSLWGPETRLVICGDKKQSIYTWRGADPEVMPDLEKLIQAANGQVKTLQTSYRSKAPVLDVINALFESVYGAADYSETEKLQSNFSTEGEKPCVEFLSFDKDEELSKQEKVAAEMEAVANRIQLLIEGPEDWNPAYRYDGDDFTPTSESNAYRYSDILILLRRTTHQSALEQALRHASIPYTLGGKGRGLFARQETRDVSLFLNVVTNPKDAYSLIGFLRSPWVGFSDETLAELAWSEEGFFVDALLKNYSTKTDVIDRYRELLGTKLASELVRMLIDETGFDALLAGLPRGTQRLANLRKVLDWLRETERGAQTTPAAVARKLAEQIANPPNVPEAALLDPAQNAVTIMTVHGSKGLTKRVVMVPDINFRSDNDRSFARVFFDEKKNPVLGIKITAPDKSGVESPGLKAGKDRAKAVRKHELNNLFYVAMTRARDLVITSASVGKKPEGWLAQLTPLISDGIISSIPYSELAKAVDLQEGPSHESPTAEQLSAVLQTLPPAPERPALQRIPATRLAKEHDELEPEFGAMEASSLQPMEHAAALGSLGHAVLEQLALNKWVGSVPSWIDTLRDGFGIEKNEAEALTQRIERTRKMMIEKTADMQEIRPELPFVLHDGDLLIDGTIDLLCLTPERASLFDYKFTEANDSVAAHAYREQMAIYSKAVAQAFPAAEAPEISLVIISSESTRLLDLRNHL